MIDTASLLALLICGVIIVAFFFVGCIVRYRKEQKKEFELQLKTEARKASSQQNGGGDQEYQNQTENFYEENGASRADDGNGGSAGIVILDMEGSRINLGKSADYGTAGGNPQTQERRTIVDTDGDDDDDSSDASSADIDFRQFASQKSIDEHQANKSSKAGRGSKKRTKETFTVMVHEPAASESHSRNPDSGLQQENVEIKIWPPGAEPKEGPVPTSSTTAGAADTAAIGNDGAGTGNRVQTSGGGEYKDPPEDESSVVATYSL